MSRRRSQNRLADAAKKHGSQLLSDWAQLTFRTDHARIGPITMSVANWLLVVIFIAVAYFVPAQRIHVLMAAGIWLLITLGRAGAIMPKRRDTLTRIYSQIQRTAGLPRGTATNPIDPTSYITVTHWGTSRTPTNMLLTVGDCPASTSVFAQPVVERATITALGQPPAGCEWVPTWEKPTIMRVTAEREGSDPALQFNYFANARKIVGGLLRLRAANAADYDLAMQGWQTVETKAGQSMSVPTSVVIDMGPQDTTDPVFRHNVEDTLDRRLHCPGEWIFTWADATLEMQQVDRGDVQAKRKRASRKIGDDVTGIMPPSRGQSAPVTTVTGWFDRPGVAPDYPRTIEVNFGTRNLADRHDRARFEATFDTSMESTYKDVTWLYDWRFEGGNTLVVAQATSKRSETALRKFATRRLRNVVESKFGTSRRFVDCDIESWQDKKGNRGEALPQVAHVNFGDFDVTKEQTQTAFEMHWDSLTTACDWRYAWSPAEGEVTMTAVPPLPSYYLFPEVESSQHEEWMQLARRGVFTFGPKKGGGYLTWDMNKTPHGLVGGKTGSGKSVALSMVLYYGLMNPDRIQFIVCDPKRTDFTWTPEFPNVVKFAATDEEIVEAVSMAKAEMDKRQSLINRYPGIVNLQQLRDACAKDPKMAAEVGHVPGRLILFFDEIIDFLAKSSNKDIEELKDGARADLENIARLARALEVNILCAAQKPDGNIMKTQLRSQLGWRLGVGRLDQYESQQILLDDHGTRYPQSGTPTGRAWGYDQKDGYQFTQVAYLGHLTENIPWAKNVRQTGTIDRVRARLTELGYAATTITNADGGTEQRWVKVENSQPEPQPEPEPDEASPFA